MGAGTPAAVNAASAAARSSSSVFAQTIISYVQSLENLNGAVVLMHSIYESSVQAAAALVPWLQ